MHRLQLSGYLLVLLVLSTLLVGQSSQAAELTPDETILLVWGNPYIGPWEQNFNQIVLRELASELAVPVIPEFLSLLNTDESKLALIAESMRLKYSDTKISLVIAVQPEANSFVYRWQDLFAPDAQVLYVLPGDDLRADILANESGTILQSASREAAINTVQLIPSLLPATQQLYVVGGAGEGDRAYLERFRQAIEDSGLEIATSYLGGLLPDELLATLAEAPDNSALLLGTYDVDRTGQILRTIDISRQLLHESTLPMFGVFDTLISDGILGGNVTSSTLYAEKTLEFALGLLVGSQFDPASTSDTTYLFDATQLERFGIDRRQLPEGSTILNDSANFLRDYRLELFVVGLVIIFQLVLIASLLRAIAKRRLAEKELHEPQRLDALGSLAGGIAHDFNNILTAIVGNAEIASLNANNPTMVNKLTNNILTSADRAKRLVAQILMFGRSTTEEVLDSIALEKLLEESVTQLRASAPATLTIEAFTDPALWQIKANTTQIHQALINLCVNAEYAMDNKGTISISARNISIVKPTRLLYLSIPAGDYVAISVADTGTGIDPKNLSRIFEPFFTTKPYGEGSGLGLALVYSIVKLHEGYLDLESETGRGTTVTIYIKASRSSAEQPQAEITKLNKRGNGELILMVDDDQMVLDASRRVLRQLGYRIESYTNPAEALRQFKANPEKFELMITDLSMPEMDGVRLILKIRQLRSDLPVILRTGFSDAIDKQELMELSNFTLLNKPCSIDETAEAVFRSLSYS